MTTNPELITTCKVRGLLHGGRAVCGQVGVGSPHKCWYEGECVHQVKPVKEKTDDA